MTKSQIDYYEALSEENKYILSIAALKAFSITLYDISYLAQPKFILTQKKIKIILEEAVRYKLFAQVEYMRNDWEVSVEFMMYIYPKLTSFKVEWIKIYSSYNYYSNSHLKYFRNCLYTLLHNQKEYYKEESGFISISQNIAVDYYSKFIEKKEYESFIHIISIDFLSEIISKKIEYYLLGLLPITELKEKIDNIITLVSPIDGLSIPTVDQYISLFKGDIERAIELNDDVMSFFNYEAIEKLMHNDPETALICFEKDMKIQHGLYKGIQIPVLSHFAIYYLSALLCVKTEISSPVIQKIAKSFERKNTTTYEEAFKPVVYYALNDKPKLASYIILINNTIKSGSHNLLNLTCILVLYLTDSKPTASIYQQIKQTIENAYNSGYITLAYEAAYALKMWTNSSESIQLYTKIAQSLTIQYQPVISRIERQEEWEKSLNLLLGLGLAKNSTKQKDNTESSSRIVYYFNFKNRHIQPVLQSRQVKGWSKGRNIAMKSFFEGKTKEMSDQDLRISKTIKHYNDYYADAYEFTENALKEIIGHPYVFLDGTDDVPVEIIAAQPVIQVIKTAKGYSLTTDIVDISEKLLLVKETNTRFKVYDLNAHQIQILQIILQQKIVVPEAGKEKLIQLLGGFSAHMTVHSDLLASVNDRVNIKEVEADTRIRVQLLPLGDGLKAELFSKPFGSHPPYCKPGKGGKVLIANDNGIQLQVKRNLKQESEYAELLLGEIETLESLNISDDLIAFDDPLDSLLLLDILTKYQDKCVVEWPEGERFRIKGTVGFNNLNLRLKSNANWFDLQGELKVDEKTVITLQQLLALTEKGHDKFIELSPGEFLALSNELKKQLEELRTFTTKGKSGVQLNKFASVALEDFFDNVENLKTDKSWKEFRARVDNVKENEYEIPTTLQADLRPYQEDGFRWMARLAEWEGGACLADDMGLGKTIQTLAILLHRSKVGPALVICPVSVIGNWINETERFTPTLNVKTFGNSNRNQTLESLEAGDLLITSYGLLQSEEKLFSEKTFATVVLDEAHTIKNYATKTSKASMQLKASFRIALTGTPLQNHLGEIWNLFNFVNPGLLGNMKHFTDTFIKPDTEYARKHLKKLITPFILRRTKSAVLDELPPKTEIVKKVQLSDEEMAFYEALRRKAIQNIEDDKSTGTNHFQVLAEITKLRQASCNALLVDPTINIGSSKQTAFLEIVDELILNKHRALVFSQFVSHLAIMRKALDAKGINYQYLDGSTSQPEREKNVKRFQSGEGDLFLISLKAGGLGLNLTAADYVIHLDPWWNPAIEDQASDRAHRIGQIRPVTIYRLVAENTIEEKIIQLHSTKRNLAESLLEGSDQSARMSVNELVSLIKDRD
jgi:SNF2 family DNA or RNA helicase